MMRPADKEKHRTIYNLLIAGETAANIAKAKKISPSTISRKVQYMKKKGIIVETGYGYIKTYAPGPAAAAFFKNADDDKNIHATITPTGVSCDTLTRQDAAKVFNDSDHPPITYYTGHTPRVHKIIYNADVPHFSPPPPGTRWGRVKPSENNRNKDIYAVAWKKQKTTKAGVNFYYAVVSIPYLKKPAKVMFQGKEKYNMQITLPIVYVLKEWLPALEKGALNKLFKDMAASIIDTFTAHGFDIRNGPRAPEKSIHYAHYIPILQREEDILPGNKVTAWWFDNSEGPTKRDAETKEHKKSAHIGEGLDLLSELPEILPPLMEKADMLEEEAKHIYNKAKSNEQAIQTTAAAISAIQENLTALTEAITLLSQVVTQTPQQPQQLKKEAPKDLYQ
ncbi:MAG: hypothetical protein J7L32_05395 [Thermoplasmata archaeon]|nr:hypothetical protein [Thermoplasmata archaeon]